MNILLWIFQIILALHTIMGAVWKFSHSAADTMPSLKAIPQPMWLALSILELLCAIALIIPVLNKRLGRLTPIAALGIAAEMVLFTVLHFVSGDSNFGPVVYWLVVASACAFVAYGRLSLRPIK